MENSRQKKVSKILQKDIAEILQERLKKQGTAGVIVSVTRVDLSVDFSVAKVFLSVFQETSCPFEKRFLIFAVFDSACLPMI